MECERLALMLMIWSFMAGWTHLLSGHFSPIEIGLTIVIGIARVCGIVLGLRWRTAMNTPAALGVFVLFAALQIAALRLSFLPNIANQ